MAMVLFFAIAMAAGAAAYSVKNAFDEIWIADGSNGSGYQMADFLSKLFLAPELDQETDAFFEFLQKSIKTFDLYELYQSPYLRANGDGFKAVAFHGRNLPDKYTINLKKNGNSNQTPLSKLGDCDVRFRLKRKKSAITKARSFEADMASCMAVKQFTHKALSAWMKGMYQIIDPVNITNLSFHQADVFDAIKGDFRKPIDAYYAMFPAQTRFFDQYADLKSFIAFKTYQQQTYTRMDLELSPRMNGLKKDFRYLHDYLNTLIETIWISIDLETMDGLKIMAFALDSNTHSLFWHFNTRNGKIIPSNTAGEPVFKREFSISDVDHYQLNANINITVHLYGLRGNTGTIATRITYDHLQNGTDISFKAIDIPTPKIRGRAFKIVPLSLVNIFIPSNIDKLAYQFVRRLQEANEGAGTTLQMNWDVSHPAEALMKVEGYTELLDNRFVNVVLRLLSKRFQPDPDAISDMARFFGLFYQKMLPGHRTAL